MTATTMKLEYRSFKYLDSSAIIKSDYKTKLDNEDEEAFSNSIKENGIITPLIVSVSRDGNKYQAITGHRRLYHAQKQKLKDVPCIIWKNATNPDIALAQLIEVAHKQDHSDEQKAKAISKVYESIGVKPKQAIQFVKQMHNQDYKENKTETANSQTFKSNTNRIAKEIKPTSEFLKLFEKIGYSAPQQYSYLQLVTQLEPEVLEYAEKQRLPMRTKTLLTHSQLQKTLNEKSNVPEEKIAFKKGLVAKLRGKRESESRDIIHQAIGDLKDNVYDLKTGVVQGSRNKEVFDYNASKVTEGREGAIHAFSQGVELIQKLTTLLTAGHLKLERGESSFDEIPIERIKKVVKTYMIEMIKNLDDQELRSMNDKLSLLSKLIPEVVNLMDEEEDFRVQKKNMLST